MNTSTDDERSSRVSGADTQKAGRREWIGLTILALPTILVSMDLTVLYLAVPALSADLKPTAFAASGGSSGGPHRSGRGRRPFCAAATQ